MSIRNDRSPVLEGIDWRMPQENLASDGSRMSGFLLQIRALVIPSDVTGTIDSFSSDLAAAHAMISSWNGLRGFRAKRERRMLKPI